MIMKSKLDREYFIILLPLFFVIHEYLFYFPIVKVEIALVVFIQHIALITALLLISFFLLRKFLKASLFTFFLYLIHLFYGAVHDFLKSTFENSFLLKYSFILPFLLIYCAILFFYFKRTNKQFIKLKTFLNLLFAVLILFDLVSFLLNKKESNSVSLPNSEFLLSNTTLQSKPDIYLIITDEYAGEKELQDIFLYDNSKFMEDLKGRGFYVVQNSKSNYNATVFSMASMLNLNYLNLQSNKISLHNVLECRELVNKNIFTNYLKQQGYSIYNYSFFDLENQKYAVRNLFFPTHKDLFNSQTFTRRIAANIGFNFVSKDEVERVRRNNVYNDNKIDSLTRNNIVNSTSPKFVYTHFTMPHHPYFFDSLGRPTPLEKLSDDYNSDKNRYISYLKYTNKILLDLIDHIQSKSKTPPIILLMSDHGWRQFENEVNQEYFFMNLNALYFPNKNYSKLYDGMSNVNQMRVLLNTYFDQQLPLLPDSTYFVYE